MLEQEEACPCDQLFAGVSISTSDIENERIASVREELAVTKDTISKMGSEVKTGSDQMDSQSAAS